MKSPHLYIALIFASVLAFQAQSEHLSAASFSYPGQFNFRDLIKEAYVAKDSTQAVSNVLRYYIEGTTYFNYIQKLFCNANTAGGEFITLEQYYSITDDQNIHRIDAQRVSEYVRGVFGHPHTDTDDIPIDSFTFNQAVDILFAESVSIVTFTYVTGTSVHTRAVTVGRDEVLMALVRLFNKFQGVFPLPDCEELAYLFVQCDADKDGGLNIQEFHIFLSIYLRYYKYGVQSNRYAATIMMDQVFTYVIENAEGLGAREDRTNFLRLAFRRFVQATMSDKIQNQMAHLFFTKFDADNSGAIDPQEFAALLSFFHAPTNEIDVLFIAADTDGSGEIDFSEFGVALTTLLRKLAADFGWNLLHATGGKTTVGDVYLIFHEIELAENVDLIEASEFGAIYSRIDTRGTGSLSQEDFTRFVSEVISYLRTQMRALEEAQITAVAGIDVNSASPSDIIAIKESASEQVGDILYSDLDIPADIEDIIAEVEDQTGVPAEDLEAAVASQIEGATIVDVIEIVAEASTEAVIDAIATSALEHIETSDCPTRGEVVDAIDSAIEDGVVETVIEEVEHLSQEEIVETVTEAVEVAQITEEATQALELSGDLDEADTIIESVGDYTGTELTTEDLVEIITEQTGAETVEDVIEVIENSSTEELIETVTAAIEEQVHEEPERHEWEYEEGVMDHIEDGSGVTIDDVEAQVEAETGATLEQVIEAATTVATEELVDVVTTAVLEEASSNDCATPETIEEVIHEVIEDGAVEDIIETIEEASTTEIADAVEGAIEEIEAHEEAGDVEEPHEDAAEDFEADDSPVEEPVEEPLTIDEQIEESGYTETQIENAIEAEIGDATIEDIVEAAETIATEEVVTAVTDAVAEEVEAHGCVTEEGIQEAIETVIEDGTIDDIVEDLEDLPTEQIVETIATEAGGDWEEEHADYGEPLIDEIEQDNGYTETLIEDAIETELEGATITEVIDAVETIATEEVLTAVTEAAYEEAAANDCVTAEGIQEAIETVIEDGVVDDIIEDLEDATPEDVIETVTETIEEEHEVHPEAPIEEEVHEDSGYTEAQIENAIEAEVDGATITEVIEAAETVATEEVITAVTDAVAEEVEAQGCVTEEGIHEAIETVIEDGTVDTIIEHIEDAPPAAVIETITEVIEEEHHEEHDEDVLEGVTVETGYDDIQIEHAIEAETGVSIEQVIDAAETIATEEVLDAVADAVIEEAQSSDCPTQQSIEAVIEDAIEGGIVETIVENIAEASPVEILEAVEEEAHNEGIYEGITEETGLGDIQIEQAVEAEIGASIDDVVEVAEAMATEEVLDAVADAVLEEAASSDCPTPQSVDLIIEEVLEGGIVDEIVENLEEAAPEEIIEAVSEAVEEGSPVEDYSSYLQLSSNKSKGKHFLRKFRD